MSQEFPLITLGAFGLGSTWAAIPPQLDSDSTTPFQQVALAILGTLYLTLDIASYMPLVRRMSGIIRIAVTIIAGLIILPKTYGSSYMSSALTMLAAQVARGIFETFIPLPQLLYRRSGYQYLLIQGFVLFEVAASLLNAIRIIGTLLPSGTQGLIKAVTYNQANDFP